MGPVSIRTFPRQLMALMPISGLLSVRRALRSWTSALFLIPCFIASVLVASHPGEPKPCRLGHGQSASVVRSWANTAPKAVTCVTNFSVGGLACIHMFERSWLPMLEEQHCRYRCDRVVRTVESAGRDGYRAAREEEGHRPLSRWRPGRRSPVCGEDVTKKGPENRTLQSTRDEYRVLTSLTRGPEGS
jgi:hypothetical protein